MYFIPYLFSLVYIFIRCIDFSSWLGLACIVLFLILTVHSYVAPTLNKFILFIYLKGAPYHTYLQKSREHSVPISMRSIYILQTKWALFLSIRYAAEFFFNTAKK